MVFSDDHTLAFLDHRPLFPGHSLLVPRNRKDGLRGFFWPRTKYDSEAHMRETADAVRAAVGRLSD